jgi:hypothetical protein
MNLAMLFGFINTRGGIPLQLIPYGDCKSIGTHCIYTHLGHVLVDIHSVNPGSGTVERLLVQVLIN